MNYSLTGRILTWLNGFDPNRGFFNLFTSISPSLDKKHLTPHPLPNKNKNLNPTQKGRFPYTFNSNIPNGVLSQK